MKTTKPPTETPTPSSSPTSKLESEPSSANPAGPALTLYIKNREGAELALLGPHPYTHLVSIDDCGPGSEPVPGFATVPKRLFLAFDDISHNVGVWVRQGYIPPDERVVQQIIDFVQGVPDTADTHFLVHCAAGISRSTATAFILRAIQRGEGAELEALCDVVAVRPIAHPNRLMVELADRLLGRGGRMIEALTSLEEARRAGLL